MWCEIIDDKEGDYSEDHDDLNLAHGAGVLLKRVNLPLDGLDVGDQSMKLQLCVILDDLRINVFFLVRIFEVARRQEAVLNLKHVGKHGCPLLCIVDLPLHFILKILYLLENLVFESVVEVRVLR